MNGGDGEVLQGERLCQTVTEIIEWPSQFLKLLPEEGNALLKKSFENGVLVTSHYSGIASVETILAYLCDTAKGDAEDGWNGLRMYSATDINPACRVALAEHGGPEHIFGDLVGAWDVQTQMGLKRAQQQMQQSAEAMPAELLPDVWVRTLENVMMQGTLVEQGWCYKHHRMCKLHTTRPKGWLSMNCAGSTCIDFSTMGLRKREQGSEGVITRVSRKVCDTTWLLCGLAAKGKV